jgi:hypothetical protein
LCLPMFQAIDNTLELFSAWRCWTDLASEHAVA